MRSDVLLVMSKTFAQAADEVFAECRELLIRKQQDYGHGNIMDFGELGVLVRVNDKVRRLRNLWESDRLDDPSNESVDDSWMDLLNYAAIALMLRRGTFSLPLEGDATNAPRPQRMILRNGREVPCTGCFTDEELDNEPFMITD